MEYIHTEQYQESCLVLACLDYLKSLRRKTAQEESSQSSKQHQQTTKSHIDKDYVTLAIWALTRSLQAHEDIQCDLEKLPSRKYPHQEDDGKDYTFGNDPYLSLTQIQKQKKLTAAAMSRSNAELYRHRWSSKSSLLTPASSSSSSSLSMGSLIGKLTPNILIPTLENMEQEIILSASTSDSSSYEYNDFHYSNSHRYFTHKGLASIPLTLPTIVQEGLTALDAKTRMEAENNFEKDPMYLEFVSIVQSKGFLTVLPTEVMIRKRENPKYKDYTLEQVKEDMCNHRWRKVKHKFRNKVYASFSSTTASSSWYPSDKTKQKPTTSHDSTLNNQLAKVPTISTLSKDYSLPSIPTTSTEPEEDDGLFSLTSTKSSGNAESVREIKSRKSVKSMSSVSSGISVTTSTSVNTKNHDTMDHNTIKDKLQKSNRNIVPLKKAVVSSVPMMKSTKSIDGDNESLNFHEDDLCSRLSQKSGRMSYGSSTSTKDDPEKVKEAEMFKSKGNECMKEKKYDKAKKFYTQAIDVLPFGKTSHVYYCNRAAALLSMRYFSEAAFDAEQSIELKPHYSKAYCRLGLANFFLGNYQKALDTYSMALQYDPNNESCLAYVERCKKILLQKSEEPLKDQKDFGNVINGGNVNVPFNYNKKAPTVPSQHQAFISTKNNNHIDPNQRGVREEKENEPQSSYLIEKKKRMEDARRVLNMDQTSHRRISSSDQRNDENEGNASWKMQEEKANDLKVQGNKAMAKKNYAEAIQFYSNALRISPAGPSSHVFFTNRAAAYCYLELYEDSESDAERALALKPDFGKAHSRLGLSRYFLRDYEGAIEAYENAISYDPGSEVNRAYLEKAKRRLLESKR